MFNICDYLLKDKRKIHKLSVTWIIIIVFIIGGLIIINNSIKLKNYYVTSGITKNEDLILIVPVSEIKNITSKNTLYIENKKYFYKIEEIDEEIINDSTNLYKRVVIKVNLKDRDFIDNNVIELKFIINEMTILEYISNFLKGV